MKIKKIDPPSGWLHGFPKVIPQEILDAGFDRVRSWLVENGYPLRLIEQFKDKDGNYPYFHYRIIEETYEDAPAKKLKTLDEHNSTNMQSHFSLNDNKPIKNGIECPDCGEELYDSNPMVTLTSMPPKKNISCKNCGYTGYRIA